MDFLTNILSGGLLGVITSIFSTYAKYKEKQADQEFKLKMIDAQSKASIAEIKANIEVNKIVTEGNVSIENARADTAETLGRTSLITRLTGNYIHDDILKQMLNDNTLVGKIFRPLIYLHLLFMDLIRGLIRPILTVGIIYYIVQILNKALTKYLITGTDSDLMILVINPAITLLLFAASTVIGFWFADKAMSRRYQQGTK